MFSGVSRMNFQKCSLLLVLSLCTAPAFFSQTSPPFPLPTATPVKGISEMLAKNLETHEHGVEVPRDRREQAYAKLLEGQRYMWSWSAGRARSQARIAHVLQNAKQAFIKSVEFDPSLAEGYTALAEIAINSVPGDIDEAIGLASIAVKIEPDNYGARRILARLYTYKSRLTTGSLDPAFANRAISEWKNVARLDPRNAEAWAFLSEFYAKTNKPEDEITALKNWVSSASPLETQFYRRMMGNEENLSPERASLKLGPALLKAGRVPEAIFTLAAFVADEPENAVAVDLLREAIESAQGETAAVAIESLQQAAFANPENVALIDLLAQVHVRAGKFGDAERLLRNAASKQLAGNKESAAVLQVALGDLYARADRSGDAIAAYESALKTRGIVETAITESDKREFAMQVLEKIIVTYKNADMPNDARATIDRSRKYFGKDDLFADRQLISFYRETGKKPEALEAIRAVRSKLPDDYGFLRLEATLLTETGKVDEAVTLIKGLMASSKPVVSSTSGMGNNSVSVALPTHDVFSNYLFISNLYSQADRGKDAADAANQALAVARGSERKQIAKLTLATAQQQAGDYKAAESTLREILKVTPGNPIALNNLGYFLLERDERINEAFDLIQQALKVDPTNPSFLDSLGWAYFKLGNLIEAEKYLKDAARSDSGSSTIHEHLGDVYSKQAKTDLAKTAWEKALNLASDSADVSRLKAKLAIKPSK